MGAFQGTGEMQFMATKTDVTSLCISVTHWSYDTKGKKIVVGRIQRDCALRILDNSNDNRAPLLLDKMSGTGTREIHACAGVPLHIDMTLFDVNGDSTTLSWRGDIPASFKLNNISIRKPEVDTA